MEFAPFTIQADTTQLHSVLQEACATRSIALESIQATFMSRTLTLYDTHTQTQIEAQTAQAILCDETRYNAPDFNIQQVCELHITLRQTQDFRIILSPEKDKALLHCDGSFLALAELRESFIDQALAKLALLGVIMRDIESLRARLAELHAHLAQKPTQATSNASDKATHNDKMCIIRVEHFTPATQAAFHFKPQIAYEKECALESIAMLDSVLLDSSETSTRDSRNSSLTESTPSSFTARFYSSVRREEAFYGVRAGELVGVYKFGNSGVGGRNVLGEYVLESKPSARVIPTNEPYITHKAYDDRIEYYSQIQGFIALRNAHTAPYATPYSAMYSLDSTPQDTLDSSVDSTSSQRSDGIFCFFIPPRTPLTSTNTPPLLRGIHARIALCVESSDESIDALGDGVHIQAHSLEISGNLGRDTTIHATHLIINGTSHTRSHILANSAKILTHRGLLIAQDCTIKNADSSTIYATTARIYESNASTIYARHIRLDRLRNANSCHFSQRLEILEIPQKRGSDNALIFDIASDRAFCEYLYKARAYLTHTSEKKATLESELAALERAYISAHTLLKKMQGFNKTQQSIALQNQDFARDYRQAIICYKSYQALLSRLQAIEKALNTLQTQIHSTHRHLQRASVRIGNVSGFDNYALVRAYEITTPTATTSHTATSHTQAALDSSAVESNAIESNAANARLDSSTPQTHTNSRANPSSQLTSTITQKLLLQCGNSAHISLARDTLQLQSHYD